MKDYDSSKDTNKPERRLPHWTQDNCTYFITFRLHDSIPKNKLEAWNEERQRWLRSQNIEEALPLGDILASLDPKQKKTYYETFWKGYHDMLDNCYGSCILRDSRNAQTIANALLFFDNERYDLGDFIVMPNHVHLLITPFFPWGISELLHSWKRFTAREINKLTEQTGQLWQHESYDHIVRNEEQLKRIQKYIKNNPKNLKDGEFYHHEGRVS
mgnify:CR=1 FL=1